MIGSDGEASQSFFANCQFDLAFKPASGLPTHSSLDGTSIRAATRNSSPGSGGLGLPAIRCVVDPHPMQDDRQSPSHSYGRLLFATPAGYSKPPRF
jgi:hypothetical protein